MSDDSFDIFISYRRIDTAGHARALYRDLCRRFDKRRIFFDRESIEAGAVFPDRLREGIKSCRVLLALVAPGWLESKTARGVRRLDCEHDFVRQEIASALQDKKVLPVLFDDTPMPEAVQLPAPLRALAGRDALMLRGKNLEYDVQLEALVGILAAVPGMPAPLPAEQGVIVGGARDFDVYRGTRFIPIRLRAPLRAAFKPLIEDRTHIFAGRRQVFDRIMTFAARDEGGYLVITAPPGFGKTALVANLVAATPEAFAYHFFAPVYGAETLDEKFDIWMARNHPNIPFERYADDAICHCRSEAQARTLRASLEKRFAQCGLTLHPDKTKVVYCKDDDRCGDHPDHKFERFGRGCRAEGMGSASRSVRRSAAKLSNRSGKPSDTGRSINAATRRSPIWHGCSTTISAAGSITTVVSTSRLSIPPCATSTVSWHDGRIGSSSR